MLLLEVLLVGIDLQQEHHKYINVVVGCIVGRK